MLPYLVPYLLSLIISSAVGIYVWRRRDVIGASPFALYALAQASWTLGYIFELASSSLEGKVFWDNFQWIGAFGAPLALLAFALEYTGHKWAHPKRTWGLLAVAPIIFLVLVYTNDLHRWARSAAWLIPGEPFSELRYDFTLSTWVVSLYGYGLCLAGLYMLVGKLVRSPGLYRTQLAVIVLGFLVPLVGATLTLAGITLTFHRDTTPLTFAIGNLVVAWGLLRYRLFDIVPVARDTVIESMPDAVVVLDAQGRLVDLNPAALQALGRPASEVIGQPASLVYAKWPDLLAQFQDVEETRAEITEGTGENRRHHELSISPLRNRRGRLVGRLIVLHDITERKRAEGALQEERDFISAVMDTAGALVVVFDPQGRIVRMNRACEELTGYAFAEVRGRPFWDLFLTPEEMEPVQAIFEELLDGQFPKEHESYWSAKDGSRRLIAWSNTCLLTPDGSVDYVIATGIDVEEERRRQRQASILAEMANLVSGTLDLDQVLDRTAEYARDILEADHCSVTLYDESGETLRYVAGKGFPSEVLARLKAVRIRPTNTFREIVLQALQPMTIEDASSDPRVDAQMMELVALLNIQSILAAPIEAGGRALGYLTLTNQRGQPHRFTSEDTDLAVAMASQAAMAIENARHYEEEQRRAEQFRLINDVGRRITSILSVDDLLQEVVRLIKDGLGYYLVGIALIEGDELVFKTGAGAVWDGVPEFESPRLKVGQEGITGWVAQSGDPLLVPDVSQEPRYYAHPLAQEVHSELAVPLKTKEKVIGVLHVQSVQINAFDQSDLDVLQSLGHQAAIAIENAQLYEQAQQVAVFQERQRLARDLHDSVTQSLYSLTLLAEAGQRMIKVRDLQQVRKNQARLSEIAQQALQEMRLMVYELRPLPLQELGLARALQQRLEAVEQRAGLAARLVIEGEINLPAGILEEVYRIAQEALNNALKHARASAVTVTIRTEGEYFALEVRDNGQGFDPQAVGDQGGLGLVSMRERAQNVGGCLSVYSAPGEGTCVRVTTFPQELPDSSYS